jgi:hypothetical protein
MLIYFDESYDSQKDFLILGSLFSPDPRKLHRDMLRAKQRANYVDGLGNPLEIKYTTANIPRRYKVARECINCFVSSASWFRAIVIDTNASSDFDLSYFGKAHERDALKMARAYKKFAEMLLSSNCVDVENGVLLTDRLTRTKGDLFLELMRANFCQAGAGFSTGKSQPTFKHIQEVDTAYPPYQVGQICDLLMGAILNSLKPTRNEYKTRLRSHVIRSLALPSLDPAYWQSMPKWKAERKHPKFVVWFWRPNRQT